jgi:hypothetical protein
MPTAYGPYRSTRGHMSSKILDDAYADHRPSQGPSHRFRRHSGKGILYTYIYARQVEQVQPLCFAGRKLHQRKTGSRSVAVPHKESAVPAIAMGCDPENYGENPNCNYR